MTTADLEKQYDARYNMSYIDFENWPRKDHFKFFHRMDYPHFNICMNIDVSSFVKFTRQNGLSFYYAMIFAATSTANQIDNFKYRIHDDKVVIYDKIHSSFTDMNKNNKDNLFKLLTLELKNDIYEFEKSAKEASENQQEYFIPAQHIGRDDLVYITCVPWISFTQVSHPIVLDRNDSIPRISWGKYYKQEDKILLPLSVQVNHALADGFHVGVYIETLQMFINDIR